MTLGEKLHKIREAIKEGKGGAVFEYFYDYYKFEAFVIFAVLFFVGNLTYTKLTDKDIVLSGALLNQYNILAEDLILDMGEDFLTEKGYDLKENKVEFFYTKLDTQKYLKQITKKYQLQEVEEFHLVLFYKI